MRFRGPGEVLGTRQSGPDFTLASLVEDQEVLELAREAAEVIARDESLERWPLLQAELKYRYERCDFDIVLQNPVGSVLMAKMNIALEAVQNLVPLLRAYKFPHCLNFATEKG